MDGHITRFEDLIAWQRARELTNVIYRVSTPRPFSRDFAMRNQIRSAALSRSQLYAAFDQGYVNDVTLESSLTQATRTSSVIRKLQMSLERKSRGTQHAARGTEPCS